MGYSQFKFLPPNELKGLTDGEIKKFYVIKICSKSK